jgi:small subunit ribosomal protein S26e
MAAPYKRTYKHTSGRGGEQYVTCEYCGKKVPRFKALTQERGFRISDPVVKKQIDRRQVSTISNKIYVCPSCARHRGIVQIGKSRKSRTKSNNLPY